MAALEAAHTWNFTSTGTGKFIRCGLGQSITFGLETSPASTATIQILHRMGSSSGVSGVLSTNQCSSGTMTTDQYLGPLEWVAPRIVDKTAGSTNTITAYLKAV